MPVRVTACGLPAALSVMWRVAFNVPSLIAKNLTTIVQLFPGASEDPQKLIAVKSPESVPGPGVTDTFEIDTVRVPMLFTITFLDRILNGVTVPKLMLVGVTLTCAPGVTFSVTVAECVFEPSVPVTVRV